MKKTSVLLLLIMCLPALADIEKNKAMFDMMVKMSTSAPMNGMGEAAACLKIPQDKLNALMEKAMRRCFEQHKASEFEVFMASMERCIEPAFAKETGLSQAKLDACRPQANPLETQLDELDTQVDALMAQLEGLYESGANEKEIQALEQRLQVLEDRQIALEDQLHGIPAGDIDSQDLQAAVKQMEGMVQAMSKASEGTLHLITLPIYKNSQVMIHMIDGASMMGVEKTLPAATFASPDPVEKIVDFYRRQLPRFKYKNLGDGEHIFMESMPDDFDMLKHMNLYLSTPHVLIRTDDASVKPGVPTGTQANIEIAYREKSKDSD